MDKLMQILSELRPDVDFANETALIDTGVLDSFDIISLVSELNDAFSISISPADLDPENFNSAEALRELVQRLVDED